MATYTGNFHHNSAFCSGWGKKYCVLLPGPMAEQPAESPIQGPPTLCRPLSPFHCAPSQGSMGVCMVNMSFVMGKLCNHMYLYCQPRHFLNVSSSNSVQLIVFV